MKRTRFTEPQIVSALKLAESGTSAANVCRKYGSSDATFSMLTVDGELEIVVWPNGVDLAPEYIYFRVFKNEPELQT